MKHEVHMKLFYQKPSNWLFGFILLFGLHSCANYKTNFASVVQNWQQTPAPPTDSISYSVLAIGNLGDSPDNSPVWQSYQQKLNSLTQPSAALFLGNNLSQGMPRSEHPERKLAERKLDRVVRLVDDFDGKVYFVAGNGDWAKEGRAGVKRQKEYLEDELDRDDLYFPDPGCGDPEEIELDDQTTLILLDSQWWLEDWNGQPKINAGCEIKDRGVYKQYFEDMIKGNRTKNVLVATHHPLLSNGYYGGQHPIKRHLFPLTFLNENLYIPLPILGTLATTIRSSTTNEQYLSNPSYRGLSELLIDAARKNGGFTFVAAHENSQQYFEEDRQAILVTGAGATPHAARTGGQGLFAAGRAGFSQIDFLKNGAVWVTFFNTEGVPLFKHQAHPPRAVIPIGPVKDNDEISILDTLPKEISKDDFTRGGFGRLILGEHYRKAYNAKIPTPLLDLPSFKDGIVPIKKGGGYQTNSLRLEAGDGKQYTMRSIDKDPSRTVPYPFNRSFILDVVKDNFSASHPLGALPIPEMASAVGVYHTNPEFFFVPKQEALGTYNNQFGNALYLVEERPDDEVWTAQASFGFPKEIESTSNTLENLMEEHDHIINYRQVVRSRLFDFFLGDWDRHDDQWRWAVIEEEDIKYYSPIPRDRDQAFSNYDGLAIPFFSEFSPDINKLRAFKGNNKNFHATSHGARFFDATFLSGADWSVWEEELVRMQKLLTDEVIESAFQSAWPEAVYEIDGPKIIATLKERRANLRNFAEVFYQKKARAVDVIGTNEEDYFLVERFNNGDVNVKVWGAKKDGELKNQYFERTFKKGETKEVRLYGLDKKDRFEFKGEAIGGPLVRAIGGLGEDKFQDKVQEGSIRKNYIYDAKSLDIDYQPGKSTKLLLKEDPKFNTYNRKSLDYQFDFVGILPSLTFNPDDGFLVGTTLNIRKYGFQKAPFSSAHKVDLRYAIETGGWLLKYQGEWIDRIMKWDILLQSHFQTPFYTSNFYGFGNNTQNFEETLEDEELGEDFHRLRLREVDLYLGFMRRNQSRSFSIGPVFQSIAAELTDGRFIETVSDNFDPETFNGLEYVGAKALYSYTNTDQGGFPAYGIKAVAELAYLQQLNNSEISYPYIKGAFTLYRHLDANKQLVFATRIGGQYTFNNEFTIFQGAVLGGIGKESNFRGFRRDRYRGKASFYQNVDLRWKLNSNNNALLPFSSGLIVGFDHGRVWLDGEDSDRWHYSFGGGIFLNPFDQIAISLTAFRTDDEITRFVLGGGFFF